MVQVYYEVEIWLYHDEHHIQHEHEYLYHQEKYLIHELHLLTDRHETLQYHEVDESELMML